MKNAVAVNDCKQQIAHRHNPDVWSTSFALSNSWRPAKRVSRAPPTRGAAANGLPGVERSAASLPKDLALRGDARRQLDVVRDDLTNLVSDWFKASRNTVINENHLVAPPLGERLEEGWNIVSIARDQHDR